MQSPFPGMDPYIEAREIWTDFHGNLATEIQARLNAQIQPGYFARLTPYVTYEVIEIAQAPDSAPSRVQAMRPDVGVWQIAPFAPTPDVAVIDAAPVESVIDSKLPLRLFSVEIRQTVTRQLITAIEILSPVNKQPGHKAHDDYLHEREDLLESTAHFMEIDLLRGGERPPLHRPVPPAPYYVMLSRVQRRPYVEVWPIPLDSRLPVLPVPLLSPDADARLDLGAAVRIVYERGAYGVEIDYRQPAPPPALSAQEEAWVRELLLDKPYSV